MSVDLELGDYLIPIGSFICAVVAVIMLYLRVGAQLGWITGPFAQFVIMGQPPLMTAFYAIAAIASIVVCAMWCVQVYLSRN